MGNRTRKDRLFDGFAVVGKALSSGRRLELLDVLSQGPRSVERLAKEIDQSVANTSAHLRSLLAAGLVSTERDGNRVVYALAGPEVEALWAALRASAEAHNATLDRLAVDYLGDRSGLEAITRSELVQRLASDSPPLVLDIRPGEEYVAGHIPGAVSVPPDELSSRMSGFRGEQDVVAYCRGACCVYADEAVRELDGNARRLEDGFPEWRLAGLPVAVGDGR